MKTIVRLVQTTNKSDHMIVCMDEINTCVGCRITPTGSPNLDCIDNNQSSRQTIHHLRVLLVCARAVPAVRVCTCPVHACAHYSRPPTGQCGGGGWGGGGGGNPPALVRAPVLPGPASDKAAPFAPSRASPVRRRPGAGRACGRLPRPWCPRTPGAAASSGGVWGRRFFGLPPSALGPEWEGGGGSGGGPLVPWRRLLTAGGGGRHGGPGPGGQPSAGGSHPSPAPLYLEPDPRAGPRWGPSSPWPSSRGAGRPGAAVRVSGQR